MGFNQKTNWWDKNCSKMILKLMFELGIDESVKKR